MSDQDLNTSNTREEMLPLDMDDLPEFFRQKATRELNYSPDISEKKLRTLKDMVANEKELNELGFQEFELLTFLTCRKFNIEKTLDHLKRYMKYRKDYPEVFFLPPIDVLSAFMTAGFTTILPWRCKDGCAVIYSDVENWNPKQHPIDAIKQFHIFMILQCLRKPMTQVNGFKIIANLHFSLALMRICTPRNLHIVLHGIFEISPARFKEIHLLNMFGVGKLLWQAAKMFLPAKLRERVHIHKTCESLKEFFPEAVLPQNIGGTLKDYDMTWWLKKYLSPEQMSLWNY